MANPQDEEIIDLSKVKEKFSNMFKSKKSEGDQVVSAVSSDQHDIQDHKKSEHYTKHHQYESGERGSKEGSSGQQSWSAFFRQHGKWIIPLLFVLITVSTSIYLRTMPMRMPMADDWAGSTVENYYKNQFVNQVAQQYPNLPEQNRNSLVDKQWEKFVSENAQTVADQKKAAGEQFRDQFRDDSGTMYILGIDPYHYFRMVRNVLTYGSQGTSIKEGEPWDDYFLYPEGRYAGRDFHAYFGALWHWFLNLFGDVPLMTSFFFIGTIFAALSVIPAFFIGRKISGNNVGGFYAALLMATTSFFVARTTGESSDTDVYTVFFPLLIMWLFIEAYDVMRSRKWAYVLSAGAGLATGLFSMAWIGGWWYVFLFLIIAVIGHMIIEGFLLWKRGELSRGSVKKIMFGPFSVLGVYIVSSGIFTTLFSSFQDFINAVQGPLGFIRIKSVGVFSLWPNIRTTVAELNVPPFSSVVAELGGTLLLVLAIAGIIFALRKREHGRRDYMIVLLFAMWLVSSLFATTRGVRFILQVTPVFAVSVGIAVGVMWSFLSTKAHEHLKINKTVAMVILFLGLSLLFIQPARAGYQQAYNSIPAMNDQWYNTLSKIDHEGDAKAVINSWWDFGHWFKAIGNRPVTFDGAAQVGYDAYWMGHALLVPDERQTQGILRMLNCGQNNAFETLNKYWNDTPREVELLNTIVTLNEKEARAKLEELGLDTSQVDSVVKYTHCDAATDYFITSEDMIGKAGVWGHFGGWDFVRAKMYQEVSSKKEPDAVALLVSRYNLTEQAASQTYQEMQTTSADNWIATWPGFLSGFSSCTTKGQILVCPVGTQQGTVNLQIDLTTFNATVATNQGAGVSPQVLVYATREGIINKRFEGQTFGFGVILLPAGDGNYGVILADPKLATSMFTKLFFFEGHGLSCFSNFDRVRQFSGGKVSTWKVDYSCSQKDTGVFFTPVEKVDASHILIGLNGRSEAEALALATAIRTNLTSENFAVYAAKYSDDPGSAQKGGELGSFGKGVMVKDFETAAFGLKDGEISEPVKTQFGYHILFVHNRTEE